MMIITKNDYDRIIMLIFVLINVNLLNIKLFELIKI